MMGDVLVAEVAGVRHQHPDLGACLRLLECFDERTGETWTEIVPVGRGEPPERKKGRVIPKLNPIRDPPELPWHDFQSLERVGGIWENIEVKCRSVKESLREP